ncbi:MAG: replication factor C small subunit [Candidatus Thermoplasmatota archaeon]|nr:replication factor C small subunit [Candidatus Thermoplasmatota archaeon]
MQEIWTEKYRPFRLDEVVGQEDIVQRLKAIVSSGSIPHFLFTGSAGTGKTTCALALAREMFGNESWRDNFQELNASDERGIQIVRTKIKTFARAAPLGGADFKIIFLDEADSLTSDAQAALRRTMEKYSNTCRFILSCNYSSRIIPPIQSRCSVMRFSPLKKEEIREYIKRIEEGEEVKVTEDGFDTLMYVSQGDLRKAVNILQVAASFSKTIDSDNLYSSSALARPEKIGELITLALKGKFGSAKEKLEDILTEGGLAGEDVLKQIHRELFNITMEDSLRVRILDHIGEADFRLVEGADERIQLEALLARIQLLGSGRKF